LLAALVYWLRAAGIPCTLCIAASHQASFRSQGEPVLVPADEFRDLAALVQKLARVPVDERLLRSMRLLPRTDELSSPLMYS
jgi:hypothetical protein